MPHRPVVEQEEYSNVCGDGIGSLGRVLLSLPYYLVGAIASLIKETTEEKQDRINNGPCYERYVLLTLGVPFLSLLLVVVLPLALVGLLMYARTYYSRRGLQYVVYDRVPKPISSGYRLSTNVWSVGVASLNTRLSPSFIAKSSNLSRTGRRAEAISNILRVVSDRDWLANTEHNADVMETLPMAQVLCLRGVTDRTAAVILSSGLGTRYRTVISSADGKRFFKFFNSGLVVATCFRLLEVEFCSFQCSAGPDKVIDKGLLMMKVSLDSGGKGTSTGPLFAVASARSRRVGYIFNTHLQSVQDGLPRSDIRSRQLSDSQAAINDFKKRTRRSGDRVCLDVLCGDFTSTEMASLTDYKDLSSDDGVLNWACGTGVSNTQLIQCEIHEQQFNAPASLKQALCGSERSAILKSGEDPVPSDRVLIHRSLLNQSVEGGALRRFCVSTAFAGKTDHLAVFAEFEFPSA